MIQNLLQQVRLYFIWLDRKEIELIENKNVFSVVKNNVLLGMAKQNIIFSPCPSESIVILRLTSLSKRNMCGRTNSPD